MKAIKFHFHVIILDRGYFAKLHLVFSPRVQKYYTPGSERVKLGSNATYNENKLNKVTR